MRLLPAHQSDGVTLNGSLGHPSGLPKWDSPFHSITRHLLPVITLELATRLLAIRSRARFALMNRHLNVTALSRAHAARFFMSPAVHRHRQERLVIVSPGACSRA